MIALNKEYEPVNALTMRGGYISFGLPVRHHDGEKYIEDGFINIVTKGEYDFHRGDSITIKQITGANVRSSKYFTIFAKIEYKSKAQRKAEPNRELIDENIPDDL